MTPSKLLQKSNGSLEASSSSSRKQEKSSIERITKTPTKNNTSKNALNPEPVKKVQNLLEMELGTTIQEGEL